jgi:hypothetical protein
MAFADHRPIELSGEFGFADPFPQQFGDAFFEDALVDAP